MSTLLLLFNLFSTIALALPFNSTACPIEDLPWTINNLVVFTAAPANHTTATSPIDFIAFDFCDINAGLELETSCFHETNGTTALENPVHYYLCEDGDVRFRWTGRSLQIARAYRSECLGVPPYGLAFGRADTILVEMVTYNGTVATQTQVSVPITSLS